MTADKYILSIIKKKKLIPLKLTDKRINLILKIINNWGHSNIASIKASGSTAKDTALKGKADLDIFISLKNSTPNTLEEIYNTLYDYIGAYTKKYKIRRRRQNVSIRIWYKGFKIDLVPGKKQSGYHNWHNLYVRRDNTRSRIQTNIDLHIKTVINSGRRDEIIALKIWRDNMKLDFPSFYLELVVIRALYHSKHGDIANNVVKVFQYLANNFVNDVFDDPGNGNNRISDSLYKYQKQKIEKKAKVALKQKSWNSIIW